jgi:hypothetical protein
MLLLHFNKYDESTDEYETGPVVNVERTSDGQITVYTKNGSWYFTLDDDDYSKLSNPTLI